MRSSPQYGIIGGFGRRPPSARALHKCADWFTEGKVRSGVLEPLQFSGIGLSVAAASLRTRASCHPSFEVDGDRSQRKGAAVSVEASVASPAKAVDVLEQTEERFDGASVFGDALVAPDFGRRQRPAGMASPHDGILNTSQRQVLAPLLMMLSWSRLGPRLIKPTIR